MTGMETMDVGTRGGEHPFRYAVSGVAPSDGPTPSQTTGPFFAFGLTPGPYGYPFPDIHCADMAGPGVFGRKILVEGQVLAGDGSPVHDALVEILQADATGEYCSSRRKDGFTGYGRAGTGADGPEGRRQFGFRTIKPGSTQAGAAPFATLIISMRGLLNHCITRVYFPEDDHGTDPVMLQIPEGRRSTLVAVQEAPDRYRFDIRMQGPGETVFFDL